MKNKPIEVAAAILLADSKVLIGKRMKGDSNAGKWEFPGGKIHNNETPENALKREIKEELGYTLETFSFFDQIQFDYPNYSVNIRFYLCEIDSQIEVTLDSHDELKWISPDEMDDYDFLEANRVVLEKLSNHLNAGV